MPLLFSQTSPRKHPNLKLPTSYFQLANSTATPTVFYLIRGNDVGVHKIGGCIGNGEKDDHKRDRCKKKAFDRLWASYSQEFRDWFEKASLADQTRAINDGIGRTPGKRGLTNNVMQQWAIKEEVETKKAKEGAWKSQSVILEVAQQMCGGEDKLRAAVARGAIVKHNVGGIDLFSFPSAASKVSEQRCHAVTSAADSPITAEQHQEFQAWLSLHHIQIASLSFKFVSLRSGGLDRNELTLSCILAKTKNETWPPIPSLLVPLLLTPPEASQSISTIGLPCTLAIGDGIPPFGGPSAAGMASSWPTSSSSSLFPPLANVGARAGGELEPDADQLTELANKTKRAEVSFGQTWTTQHLKTSCSSECKKVPSFQCGLSPRLVGVGRPSMPWGCCSCRGSSSGACHGLWWEHDSWPGCEGQGAAYGAWWDSPRGKEGRTLQDMGGEVECHHSPWALGGDQWGNKEGWPFDKSSEELAFRIQGK